MKAVVLVFYLIIEEENSEFNKSKYGEDKNTVLV